MENKLYKAGPIRYSEYHGFRGCNILERKKLWGVIPYWSIGSFIRDAGQIEELIWLHNNPEELHKRLNNGE